MIIYLQSSPKFNCLIIDSDNQNVEILSRILGDQGYLVTTALNINLALESLQIKIPDLIFWDCSEIEEQEFNLNYFYKYLQDNKHNIAIFFLISYSNKRPADLFGRYRGKKIAIFLPHTAIAGAIEVAKLIRAKIAATGKSSP